MRRVVFSLLLPLAGCYNLVSTTDDTEPPAVWTPPATNSWEVTPPPEGLVGTGFEEGQVAPDVRLGDQLEDEVSLWQFYGKVVVLDISTIWCAPCQELAETTAETYDDYAGDGFMYVTVLQEDLHNDDPDVDDLLLWVNEYTITTPVLDDGADPQQTGDAIENGSYPAVLVIDRDMVVKERVDPPEDAGLRAAIEAVL